MSTPVQIATCTKFLYQRQSWAGPPPQIFPFVTEYKELVTTCSIPRACTGSALTECSIMQPSKKNKTTPSVTDGTIGILDRAAYFLYSLILFLLLTFHSSFLSIPSVDSSSFTSMCLSLCRPGCYALCACRGCLRLQYP